jgi:predicted ATPase/class 3 adenylate cyclase
MSFQSGSEVQAARAVPLPTGTVTFLFSDIEDSTQRWESHREAMKAAVARHEQLMGAAIKQHGGYVFKTVGDAFCAAFPTAPDAVAAAIDAQLTLAKEDFSAVDGLRIRMGLHTGFAEERNADYFGPAVNRVARLMSIGHGGQVLLSGVSRELAHSDLPSGVSLVELGSHRLKDLTEPEEVWQLTIESLAADFPALKSLDTLPNNLPIQVTSFRGREYDLDEVKKLLAEHRLLTLIGAGGIGKTRLAMQVGAEVLEQFPDGVWIADLAAITDPELVSSVIAQVLGMTQVEGRRVDESISQWLKRKTILLILDNCEHLLGTVAILADAVHRNCPQVRILATSRQALGVSGEQVMRLPSLDVPHKIGDLTPAAVMEFGAVALFVDRARLIDKSFSLGDDTSPIVADICRRLDGIPLAIELAAARVKVLSIPNLAQRLSERFKILTGGSRTALPRQKTLSALIDWSYDLLTTQEQILFTRLAIFAGGFSLDAATAVCAGDGLDEIEVLDLLSSLTDKSLMVADTTEAQERYHLLESTRAYAMEKLAAAGQREHLARRQAEYFRDRAQAADESYAAGATFAWLEAVEVDLDNYRAALEWTLTQGNDEVLGAAIAGGLQYLWNRGGLTVEGRYWVGLALKRIKEDDHPQVAARLWRAQASFSSGEASVQAAKHAIGLYEATGDASGIASSQIALGLRLFRVGRFDEAQETAVQALASSRDRGRMPDVAAALNVLAIIAGQRGDTNAARDLYAQAIAAFKANGYEFGIMVALANLAELEFAEGNADEALRLVREAVEASSRSKDKVLLATWRCNMAAYRVAVGDLEGAREAAREALRLGREDQSDSGVVAVQHLALIGALRGRPETSARLAGFVEARYKAIGEREITEKWGYEKLMATLREHISETEVEKLATEGAAWSEDQAVEEALKI